MKWYDDIHRRALLDTPYIKQFVSYAGDLSEKVILDTGCGTGVLSQIICETCSNAKIYGIDKNKESIDFCKGHYVSSSIQWICEDAQKLSFPDESIDVAFCRCLFENMEYEEQKQVMDELIRVIKRSGQILIFLNTNNSLHVSREIKNANAISAAEKKLWYLLGKQADQYSLFLRYLYSQYNCTVYPVLKDSFFPGNSYFQDYYRYSINEKALLSNNILVKCKLITERDLINYNEDLMEALRAGEYIYLYQSIVVLRKGDQIK